MVVYGVLCWGIHEHKAIVNDNGDKGLNGGVLVNPLSQLASLIQIQTNLTRVVRKVSREAEIQAFLVGHSS